MEVSSRHSQTLQHMKTNRQMQFLHVAANTCIGNDSGGHGCRLSGLLIAVAGRKDGDDSRLGVSAFRLSGLDVT